jgi:hypothetical protein
VQHFKWISENDDKKKDERVQDKDSYSEALRSLADLHFEWKPDTGKAGLRGSL